MAEVKTVKLRGGFTINLGNYESAVIQTEVELQLQEGETAEDALNQAREIVDGEIALQMKSLKKLRDVKNNRTGYTLDVVKEEQ